MKKANIPGPREVKLVGLSCQPSASQCAEDLRVETTFEELTAAVVPACQNPLRQARSASASQHAGTLE